MSIFDVIRYPISTPPKVKELNSLPVEIIEEWCNKSTLTLRGLSNFEIYYKHTLMLRIGSDEKVKSVISSIQTLKEIILNYNGPPEQENEG